MTIEEVHISSEALEGRCTKSQLGEVRAGDDIDISLNCQLKKTGKKRDKFFVDITIPYKDFQINLSGEIYAKREP